MEGLLRPWVHYAPVSSPHDVAAVLKELERDHGHLAKKIVSQANQWMDTLTVGASVTGGKQDLDTALESGVCVRVHVWACACGINTQHVVYSKRARLFEHNPLQHQLVVMLL